MADPGAFEHYHVWQVIEDRAGRRQMAIRKGRFNTRAAANQWARRWAGPIWWVRKCDEGRIDGNAECRSRPVEKQAPR